MWDSFLTYALIPFVMRELLCPKPTRYERLIRSYEIRELHCRMRWLEKTGLDETSLIIKLHYKEKSLSGF